VPAVKFISHFLNKCMLIHHRTAVSRYLSMSFGGMKRKGL